MIEQRFTITVPARTLGVDLVFLPTHSAIVDVTVRDLIPEWDLEIPSGLVIRLRWREMNQPQAFTAHVRSRGDPLWPPRVMPFLTGPGVLLDPSGAPEVWEEYHDKRGDSAKGHAERLYFFELDRRTHTVMTSVRRPDGPYLEPETVEEVEKLLLGRLKERMTCDAIPSERLVEDTGLRERLDLVSSIFQYAALHLDSDSTRIAGAFERFAAGALHVKLELEKYPHPVYAPDPNGYLLFCFAEFGIVARAAGVHPKFWTPILPSLVKMQRIFVVRCLDAHHGSITAVSDLRCPPREIDSAKLQSIDADFEKLFTACMSEEDLIATCERQIRSNLTSAHPTCFETRCGAAP
jgi:hypothetical protein